MNNEDQSLNVAMMFERLSPIVQEKLLEVLREMVKSTAEDGAENKE